MKQARFWDYRNGGLVRIKINAGQTLRHCEGGPTDEGFSYNAVAYTYDADWQTIDCESMSWGRDCDGQTEHSSTSKCWVIDLAKGYHDAELGVNFPAWEQGKASQRDYSAEAM